MSVLVVSGLKYTNVAFEIEKHVPLCEVSSCINFPLCRMQYNKQVRTRARARARARDIAL